MEPHTRHHRPAPDTCPGRGTPAHARTIDRGTRQVFRQVGLHAEDLALELAVRLRVLGKCLEAICHQREPGTLPTGREATTYQRLRRQLDDFLDALGEHEGRGRHYVPGIRRCLDAALPATPVACSGSDGCCIELLGILVGELSGHHGSEAAFSGAPLLSFSI